MTNDETRDALAIGCPVANGRAEKSAAESLEAANALLRAECEAWRHWFVEDSKIGGDDEEDANANSAFGLLECARRATDAAGILKGERKKGGD